MFRVVILISQRRVLDICREIALQGSYKKLRYTGRYHTSGSSLFLLTNSKQKWSTFCFVLLEIQNAYV
jgi:hypothetical protein